MQLGIRVNLVVWQFLDFMTLTFMSILKYIGKLCCTRDDKSFQDKSGILHTCLKKGCPMRVEADGLQGKSQKKTICEP